MPKSLKILVVFLLSWAVGMLLLLLLISLPPVQLWITQQTQSFLEKRYGISSEIAGIRISFPKNIVVEGLQIYDFNNDTLVYVEQLDMNTDLTGLLRQRFGWDKLRVSGLYCNIYRVAADSSYNFSPFQDIFSSGEKDTTEKSGWTFRPGNVACDNWDLRFSDDLLSIDWRLQLEDFKANIHALDVDSRRLEIGKIYLSGLSGIMEGATGFSLTDDQTPGSISEQSRQEDTSAWTIMVQNIEILDTDYSLDLPGSMALHTTLRSCIMDYLSVHTSPMDIGLEKVSLDQFYGKLDLKGHGGDSSAIFQNDVSTTQQTDSADKVQPAGTIPRVHIGMFSMAKSEAHLNLNTGQRNPQHLDYNHVDIAELAMEISGLSYTANSISLDLKNLQCLEACGLGIAQLQGQFTMTPQHLEVMDLLLKTDSSAIEASIAAQYPDAGELDVPDLHLDASVFTSRIYAGDAFKVMPALQNSGIIKERGVLEIDSLAGTGSPGDFHLRRAIMRTGRSSEIHVKGWFGPAGASGMPEAHMEVDTAVVLASDMLGLLADTTLLDPIMLPDTSSLRALATMRGDSLNLEIFLRSTAGNLSSHASAHILSDTIILSGNLVFGQFRPSMVAPSSTVDHFSANVDFNIQFADSILQYASVAIGCDTLGMQGKKITALHTDIQYSNPNGKINLYVDDPQFQAGLTGQISYSEEDFRCFGHLKVNMPQADSLLKVPVPFPDTHMNMDFDVALRRDKITMHAQSSDFRMSSGTNSIDVSPLALEYVQDSTSISTELKSAIADIVFESNVPLDRLQTLGMSLLRNVLNPGDTVVCSNDRLKLILTVKKPDDLVKLISKDLKALHIEQFEVSYDGSNATLLALIDVPAVQYGKLSLDSLTFALQSDTGTTHLETALSKIAYDTLYLNPIQISASNAQGALTTEISIVDHAGKVQQYLHLMAREEDSLKILQIDPDNLVIGSNIWTADPRNRILVTDSSLVVENLVLRYKNESIHLDTRNKETSITLQQVNLGNVFRSVQSPAFLHDLQGTVNGTLSVQHANKNISGNLDLDIDAIHTSGYDIGAIQMRAQKEQSGSLHFSMDFINKDNTLAVTGMSNLRTSGTELTVVPNFTNLEMFSYLLPDTIRDLSGSIMGKIDIHADRRSTGFNGFLDIADLGIAIMPYRASFHVPRERLVFEGHSVYFDSFTIQDPEKNELTLDGNLTAVHGNDVLLDLKAATKRFKWFDAEKSKHAAVAGTLHTGLELTLRGSIRNPVIQTEITIQEGTNLTYTMPGETLEIDSDRGVVYFAQAPKSEEEFAEKEFTFIGDSLVRAAGVELSALLRISDEAQFTVITNPDGGDYTTFNLAGSALYKLNNAERGQITGAFEMGNKGYYELNFYGLVKKRFSFRPGSNITWSNSVMGGQLDFAAEHEVVTNSIGLFSDEISQAEQSRYNQRLPYKVILEVQGTLSRPEIRFSIDLPQRYRSNYPTIASKLEALSRPDADAERNRQVFALLVAGTFFPSSSGGGGAGNDFATTAARNSVNAVLTQQLNNLSGQIIKGVDVDFGLNTFDEYSGGQSSSRTQMDVKVSKKLFDDRVTVEVESHINVEGSNPNIGQSNPSGMPEWAVIYELTKDGRYRIKAFRENAFDIYDGEIQNAGIAFILLKEIELPQKKKYRHTGDD
jgi:hypothetical protein